MTNSETAQVFATMPARDARFMVAATWAECTNLPEGHARKIPEFLHRQMNEEIDALECSARSICDFPDTPWEIRMFLARQCSDESRHAELFRDMFVRRGGTIGEYPVLNFQYQIICAFDTLIARLAVQNRTFEAEGDKGLTDLLDGQFADEIVHVRMANDIIRQMIRTEPRLVMKIATAINSAKHAFAGIFGQEGSKVVKYGVSEKGRLEAGFAPQEIATAKTLVLGRQVAQPRTS